MKCPVCLDPDLTMSERQGVEIDYCPRCRGVWLDRGELDKILERAGQDAARSAPPPAQPQQPISYTDRRDPHDSDIYPAQGGHRPYKKKHWLAELFD